MGVVILLTVGVVYAVLARRLDRWSVSAPIVFVAAGLALGPEGAGVLHLELTSHVVLTFTELTLATLLFADATTVPLRAAERDRGVVGRLLGLGLLLTIAAGTVAARLLAPDLGWAGAALIAAVLAPTDAALGLPVVTDPTVPVRIRRALNIESGLNDGFATPFVTVFLAALLSEEGIEAGSWVMQSAASLALAVIVAAVVGGLGGRLLAGAARRGWTSETSEQLCAVALALLSYFAAVEIGGNGFVSAFVAGLAYGAAAAEQRDSIRIAEDGALFASFVVWVVFGAAFVGPILVRPLDPATLAYAVLSLTVVRMIPVAVALARTGFAPPTVAFVGWFGPRGLASVVFTLIAVEELQEAPVDVPVFEVATWTILLSVVLHGVTAGPLARRYGRWARARDPAPELIEMAEPRARRDLLRRD